MLSFVRSYAKGPSQEVTLPLRVLDWPSEAIESLKERIAIMVVHGEVKEADAKRLAVERVRLEWERRA